MTFPDLAWHLYDFKYKKVPVYPPLLTVLWPSTSSPRIAESLRLNSQFVKKRAEP